MKTELHNTLQTLKSGGIILYPTDTVWGIGCDAQNAEAVKKVYALKNRIETKAMICLVANKKMLKRYIGQVPNNIKKALKTQVKPTTIIYNNPNQLAYNLIAEDDTIAIRIPDDKFCKKLIKAFDGAIVSTSANISGKKTPQSFKEISSDVIKGVDYVVNLHHKKTNTSPSRILKINTDGSITIIRD